MGGREVSLLKELWVQASSDATNISSGTAAELFEVLRTGSLPLDQNFLKLMLLFD